MKLRKKKEKKEKKQREKKVYVKAPLVKTILSWVFQVALVLLFAFVFVFFFCQSKTNVGQSMEATLSNDDVILVNSLAYQFSTPKRGDLIVFKPNGNKNSYSHIKRVIGLPGEKIQIKEGIIYINGSVYLESEDYPAMTNPGMAADEMTVGDNEVFVLGDNRNNSEDSRFADIGNVNLDDIEGRAWFVISPSEHRGFLK